MTDYESKQRQSSSNGLMSAATAALAIGAGTVAAAFLYNKGGAEYFNKGLSALGRGIGTLSEEFANKSLRDVAPFDNLKSLARNVINNVKTPESEIFLRTEKGPLFNALHTKNNAKAILESSTIRPLFDESYRAEQLGNISNVLGITDEETTGKVKNVIDSFWDNKFNNIYNDDDGLKFSENFMSEHFAEGKFNNGQQDVITNELKNAYEHEQTSYNFFKEEKLPELIPEFEKGFSNIDDWKSYAKVEERIGDKVFTGDRPATVNEFIADAEKYGEKYKNLHVDIDGTPTNMIDLMKQEIAKDSNFGDLSTDRSLRVGKNGSIYSTSTLDKITDSVANNYNDTIMGKISGARGRYIAKQVPVTNFFKAGTNDLVLSGTENKNLVHTENNYLRILNKTYQVTDGGLKYVEGSDKMKLKSGRYGKTARFTEKMSGTFDNPPTMYKSALSYISKFADDNWIRNIYDNYDRNKIDLDAVKSHGDSVKKEYNKLIAMSKFFSQNTRDINHRTVSKIINGHAGNLSPGAIDALSIVNKPNTEMLNTILERYYKHEKDPNQAFFNKDLTALIKSYIKDPQNALNSKIITIDKTPMFPGRNVLDFHRQLRREISKEAFLHEGGPGYNSITKAFKAAGINGEDLTNANDLAGWAVFQNKTHSYLKSGKLIDRDKMAKSIDAAHTMLIGNVKLDSDAEFTHSIRKSFRQLVHDKASYFSKGVIYDEELSHNSNKASKWIHINKIYNPLTDISEINAATKSKSFAKQFFAGKKDPHNITSATMWPYYMVERLMDPLYSVGMQLKDKDMVNVSRMAGALFFKRILPVAGTITALGYLNDTIKDYTGTGIYESIGNSLARFDLTGRKLVDRFGLTSYMRDSRAVNPISQYYNSGETEYRDYDKQVEWYRNGTSPIRKGRWWAFGSLSEYRGNKIDYFAPNYLRRLKSNYFDESLYGGSENKWAHSWIPTPTHPFAPITRLLNPYWLEQKHKDDRPYPVSGQMFDEGTPWGAILNPTLGAIIKPQVKMHVSEMKKILRGTNDDIRAKSDSTSLVRMGGIEGVAPVEYNPFGLATNGANILSINAQKDALSKNPLINLKTTGSDYITQLPTLDNNAIPVGEFIKQGTDMKQFKLSLTDALAISKGSGNVLADLMTQIMPDALNTIRGLNANIALRAETKPSEGVISNDSIFKTSAKQGRSLLENPDIVADMQNLTSTKDMLRDAAYSGKQLGGIWGFAINTIAPTKKQYQYANAGTMSSFSRKFWDASIGGRGGEFMEIARRFFPHEDHDVTKFNPLRNTMPEWMPDRFLQGDPYAAIPKGEMRLPGRGYETINNLHPDQFGDYGAYDRMKILADIAPWSTQYKEWRDIAGKTVQDPTLRANMVDMRKQVKRQSSNHEFYNYKFIGQKLASKQVVISKVVNNGTFKVLGSDEKYILAGLKPIKGSDLSPYLQAGQTVTLSSDANKATEKTLSGSISSIIYVGGKNINRQMINDGVAKPFDRPTAADAQARFTQSQVGRGKIWELIAHAQIPFIHDKYMRIDTPLQSYKNEEVYGTPYATWQHPIQGYIEPMFRKAWSYGELYQIASMGAWAFASKIRKTELNQFIKKSVYAAVVMTNPASFIGAATGYIAKLQGGNWMKYGAGIGTAIGFGGYVLANTNNPIKTGINFAAIGATVGKYVFNKPIYGAVAGAALGVGISVLRNPGFDKYKMFGPYIPKHAKRKWEIQEYFDRLNYVRYTGLYQEAARMAKLKENTDVVKLFRVLEQDKIKKAKMKSILTKASDRIDKSYLEGSQVKADLMLNIRKRMASLADPELFFKVGKYTRAALAYKRAAESTIYGLQGGASYSEILRAVPKLDRDYILEFAKERDPKKQKEILKYINPYERRVLQLAWGGKEEKVVDNATYFKDHHLPGVFWGGWRPQADMDKVQIKTIQNEGMLLSDFGYYQSQADDPGIQRINPVRIHEHDSGIGLQAKLLASLQGAGLMGVNVSLEQTKASGIQVVANILTAPGNAIKNQVQNAFGNIFTG